METSVTSQDIINTVLLLLLGCALRFLLPYVIAGLEAISKEGKWSAWPSFKPHYLSAFGLSVIGYAVPILTVPGTLKTLIEMHPASVVAIAYSGQDLGRRVLKRVISVVKAIKTNGDHDGDDGIKAQGAAVDL